MADYAIGRTGGSLRDALNQMYPMTGLGNYSTDFPPQTGAEMPSPPVPMPQPRPPGAPQGFNPNVPLIAPNFNLPYGQPAAGGAPGQVPGVGPAQLSVQGPGQAPTISGGVQMPVGQNAAIGARGRFTPRPPGAPPDYGAQLQYLARF